MVCLEGKALSLFQWVESRTLIVTWQAFRLALLKKFRSSQEGTGYECLVELRQDGTIAEYREKFEQLSAPLKDISEEMLAGIFVNGLKDVIRVEVKMSPNLSLMDLMELAQRVEDRNLVLAQARARQHHRFFLSGASRGSALSTTLMKSTELPQALPSTKADVATTLALPGLKHDSVCHLSDVET
ncbi:uncharacterized protein LOC120003349 [Tripterygium wilfordii]|uniref:uncharacterized protein LOC120003349 n=1 Tax=Tripterygium wilfordii TaxID=458696 RepID=UPI0018F861B7|nr:uncharacterized protein LOC120003349 [Tripterygium wilfordii]